MRWSLLTSAGALGMILVGCGGSPEGRVDGADNTPSVPAADTPSQPAPATESTPASAPTEACVQGTLRACLLQLPTQGSVHNCFSGKQLCTAGSWTDCKDPATLVGVRTQQFVATCPATHVARWTKLDFVVDAPANASGAAAATVSLSGNPDIVLLDTRSPADSPAKGGAGSRDVEAILGSLATQPTLTLAVATSTTPDGTMAATATVSPGYQCNAKVAP